MPFDKKVDPVWEADRIGQWFTTPGATPLDREDADQGDWCEIDDRWYPGHMIVYVDGVAYRRGNEPDRSQSELQALHSERLQMFRHAARGKG